MSFLLVTSDLITLFSREGRFMKTSLALIVGATSVFAFTHAADAQCGCEQTVSYYAPVSTAYYAPTTNYYAPTTTYYAPTTTYYAPTVAYYAPTTTYYAAAAYYAPTMAYYGGSSYYGGGYYGSYYRGGLFGTGVGGWAGFRGIDRRWD